MKVRVNKFLAILTCIAIMVSMSVPIMAFSFADDCCEIHTDSYVLDCGETNCSHGDPKDDPDEGKTETDAGKADNDKVDDDAKKDNNDITDCDVDDCTCDNCACEEDCACEEIIADCACEDECVCEEIIADCTCEEDCDCNDIAGSITSALKGIKNMTEMLFFVTPLSTGTVIYSMQTDQNLANMATGSAWTDVLQKSGSPTITVEGTAGSYNLKLDPKANSWDAIDIKLGSLSLIEGRDYTFTVSGTTTVGTKIVLGQSAAPNGWHGNNDADASGEYQITKTFTYTDLQTEISNSQNIRIQTHEADAVPFSIRNIIITQSDAPGSGEPPAFYNMQTDGNVVVGGGVSGKLVTSGGTLAVVADGDNKVINISNRSGNWNGVDISLTAFDFVAGREYTFTISGSVSAAATAILGQPNDPWGYHTSQDLSGAGTYQLSKKFTYAELQTEISNNQNRLRIQTNNTVDFSISNIIITESGGGTPPPSDDPPFAWTKILADYFRSGGNHGSTSVSITADGIDVSGRANNWDGLGINVMNLRALSDSNKDIEIKGTITGGSGSVFKVWRGGSHTDALSGSATGIIIPSGEPFATGFDHRLIADSDGAAASGFTITDILVGGVSIVDKSIIPPKSFPLTGWIFNQGAFPRHSTWNGSVMTESALAGQNGLGAFHFGSWNNTSATWANNNDSLSLCVASIGTQNNFGIQIRPNPPATGADFSLQAGDVLTVTGRVYGAASPGANRAMVLLGAGWGAENAVQSGFDGDFSSTPHSFSLKMTISAATAAMTDPGLEIRAHNNVGGHITEFFIDSITLFRCANVANHANLARATCTAPAQVCACGYFNGSQSSAWGHNWRSLNNTLHQCTADTVLGRPGCSITESHTTSTIGQTCSVCSHVIQDHDCVWGPATYDGVTCTTAGTATQSCTVAGCTNPPRVINAPALGHNVVNGVCTRCNLTPCGMCGEVGDWRWGGNEGSHWAGNCDCTAYEPHFYDANGLCKCGRTGTPTPAASPCGICGVVGNWRWGGNADVHWADNCNCTGYEAHSYNANGVCRCGRTGTPGEDGSGTPCGMCGVVGNWRWGGNADFHWADNCNCTTSSLHVFDANGVCICGATRVLAPQEAFREEDFIDTDSLIDELLRQIANGEVPTIDLTSAGSVTVISADVLLAIANAGVDVVVVLPSGFTFTIIASSISADVGAFDLNIDVIIQSDSAQHETLGGGKVDVPANSIIFKPNFHGQFGFEIKFNVTPDQIADAGLDTSTVKHFHIDAAGNVNEQGAPTVNADGSISFSISHASFHVLSGEPPVTTELGSAVIVTDLDGPSIGETIISGETGAAVTVGLEDVAARAQNLLWIIISLSAAGFLVAACLTIVAIRRKQNAKGA